MDRERVIARLKAFKEMIDESERNSERDAALEDWLAMELPLIHRIADRVEPGLSNTMHNKAMFGWLPVREGLLRLIGQLEGQQELDEMLAPQGPVLAADGLHPWVWEPAARMWDQGNRRAAIHAAAVQVDNQLKAKLNRFDISGDDLVKQAFSLEPPTQGRPRLRIPGYEAGSENYKSVHSGAMQFGAGCMMAIRNLAVHDLAEPGEQVALEQLAALSVLARWIDGATVDTSQP